jgi:hypothetical protein
MNNYCIECIVNYSKSYDIYKFNEFNNIKKQKIYFKNFNLYIQYIIDYLKNNIIKDLQNLNLVEIYLEIYDKNNLLHKFIITIQKLLSDLLNLKNQICINKSIFIHIIYENKIKFAGILEF